MSATQDLPGKVVTRFAPSPTGFLHIGGARTALFNWLFARHHGGEFHLRIEDTDRARSTEPAIAAILDGMTWLNLNWDGEVVYQFSRAARHAEVAHALLAAGHAYRCYATLEELTALREEQRAARQPMRYDGRWRDRTDWPNDADYVIRLKAPREGSVTIDDQVQGPVTVNNAELDDFVLLRSDGTPTYMLAVVVDDHDMGVTHVIRGDDHLNNAFRQLALIRAMQWPEPVYAHIPLIHGADGAKLSKRHGALGVDAYRDELPSRFDIKKLENLNGHYLRAANDGRLVALIAGRVAAALGRELTDSDTSLLQRTMPELKKRANNLNDLAASSLFYLRSRPIPMDEGAAKLLASATPGLLDRARARFAAQDDWTAAALEQVARELAESEAAKLGQIAQPLRAAVTGSAQSPGLFEVLEVLGRQEVLGRIDDALAG